MYPVGVYARLNNYFYANTSTKKKGKSHKAKSKRKNADFGNFLYMLGICLIYAEVYDKSLR
ncbi:hypothetical protein CLI64_17070 [Nostoc sp. CENA543]|nr:hypothetical protein CLI64_17070 [Nostoc sp. CENA543]